MKSIKLDKIECEHIKGINCSAKNCVYNEEENMCTAERINVGTTNAHSMNETLCGTFKPKSKL